MSLGIVFLISFFGPGAVGLLIFLALARLGIKVWPAWLFGAAAIILVGFIAAEAPYHGSTTPFLLLAGTCIGFVSWGLAALMVGVFGTLN